MNSITDRFEFRDIRPEEFDRAAEIEQIVFPPNEAGFPDDIREQARIAPDCFMVAADREDGGIAGLLYGIATNERSDAAVLHEGAGQGTQEADPYMSASPGGNV